MPFYCYCLVDTFERRSYVGWTVDPDRRLRQHNGIIKGGAKYTRGRQWTRRILVSAFHSRNHAMSFEKKWQITTRKIRKHSSVLHRRQLALDQTLIWFAAKNNYRPEIE